MGHPRRRTYLDARAIMTWPLASAAEIPTTGRICSSRPNFCSAKKEVAIFTSRSCQDQHGKSPNREILQETRTHAWQKYQATKVTCRFLGADSGMNKSSDLWQLLIVVCFYVLFLQQTWDKLPQDIHTTEFWKGGSPAPAWSPCATGTQQIPSKALPASEPKPFLGAGTPPASCSQRSEAWWCRDRILNWTVAWCYSIIRAKEAGASSTSAKGLPSLWNYTFFMDPRWSEIWSHHFST